ncbi:MAG TPA: DUF169 domain-containing protein [Sedimentisphaerales bacterium]|nr:DUF169 domain-containing protein [Sedimentisphaerales bacterium]
MDMQLKEKFIKQWKKYFNESELPICFYYTDDVRGAEPVKRASGHRCIMDDLAKVVRGASLYFEAESIGCFGGKRYLGFSDEIMPNFEYFLSCGIEGQFEGERYKKTPEMVKEMMEKLPTPKAPAKFIVFKRWDMLNESDTPEVVIFFAPADVLSGLFTLANFDEVEANAVFAPFAAGCGSIVQYPYLEKDSDRPRGVLGMFDVSSRPFVRDNILTFAVPMNKFVRMVENMEESFLITSSWSKVNRRIK